MPNWYEQDYTNTFNLLNKALSNYTEALINEERRKGYEKVLGNITEKRKAINEKYKQLLKTDEQIEQINKAFNFNKTVSDVGRQGGMYSIPENTANLLPYIQGQYEKSAGWRNELNELYESHLPMLLAIGGDEAKDLAVVLQNRQKSDIDYAERMAKAPLEHLNVANAIYDINKKLNTDLQSIVDENKKKYITEKLSKYTQSKEFSEVMANAMASVPEGSSRYYDAFKKLEKVQENILMEIDNDSNLSATEKQHLKSLVQAGIIDANKQLKPGDFYNVPRLGGGGGGAKIDISPEWDEILSRAIKMKGILGLTEGELGDAGKRSISKAKKHILDLLIKINSETDPSKKIKFQDELEKYKKTINYQGIVTGEDVVEDIKKLYFGDPDKQNSGKLPFKDLYRYVINNPRLAPALMQYSDVFLMDDYGGLILPVTKGELENYIMSKYILEYGRMQQDPAYKQQISKDLYNAARIHSKVHGWDFEEEPGQDSKWWKRLHEKIVNIGKSMSNKGQYIQSP